MWNHMIKWSFSKRSKMSIENTVYSIFLPVEHHSVHFWDIFSLSYWGIIHCSIQGQLKISEQETLFVSQHRNFDRKTLNIIETSLPCDRREMKIVSCPIILVILDNYIHRQLQFPQHRKLTWQIKIIIQLNIIVFELLFSLFFSFWRAF